MSTKDKAKPGLPLRVVEKRVDIETLKRWLPEDKRGGLGIGTICNIIGDFYCRRLVRSGFCPNDCAICEYEIIDCVRWDHPTNPEALLTWTAKDHAARMAERMAEEQKQRSFGANQFPAQETLQQTYSSLFPQRGESTNIFLELRDFYEDPDTEV